MPVVEMHGIVKAFGSLIANDHINLDIEANEIQALLGENGAGKSTLMKILYGMYQPDEGEIRVHGKAVKLRSPADAIAQGIGFVSQHFSLVPTFTVAENIILGREGHLILDQATMNRRVESLAQTYGFQIDPTERVQNLSVGEQQRVEILKALYRNCRVLILDEPTAVLTPLDTEKLFQNLRELQAQHLSVIIITHKLEEAMAVTQRVTVLRQGKVVGQQFTHDTNPTELARLMVGRTTVLAVRNEAHYITEDTALKVAHLSIVSKRGVSVLRDVSFEVHSGEVVGIAGVAGNGQSELGAVLNGMLTPTSGEIRVKEQLLRLGDPRDFIHKKVGRIPEDRLKGVIGDLSVAQNLAMESIDDFSQIGHLQHGAIQRNAQRLIENYQIKATPNDRVRTLSGGNIQKIILARTLSRQPDVLIAAQPTRGLDIGATEYVHQRLLEQKERGAGVLLISEDLEEILLLSDRILVIFRGQIVGEFIAGQVDMDKISLLMMGSHVAD
jgi:simple sugar transport system ATP-binding protein